PRVSKPRSPSSKASSRAWKADSCLSPMRLRRTSAARNCCTTARGRSPTRSSRSKFSNEGFSRRSRPPTIPMDPYVDWAVWSRERAQRVESVLGRAFAVRAASSARRLLDAMAYSLLGGGKRMRALLVYAAGEVSGALLDALDAAAAAVEMIHAY